jgi:gluconate 5-dehydrogenase
VGQAIRLPEFAFRAKRGRGDLRSAAGSESPAPLDRRRYNVAVRIFSLEGKTALVAGASRGIGLAIARQLAEAGASVTLAARSEQELRARAAEIGGRALRLDVCDPQSIADAAEAVGAPDILVNVAGTNIRKRFEEYSEEEYRTMMDTNLNGIVRLTQQIGARMIARGQGGKIVTIGSLMSLVGLPYLSIYAITKGGLAQLTKVLAAEWGRYNIQVNCIAPGFIVTDLNRHIWTSQPMLDWLKGCQANPNPGTPEDVAPLAVFLAGRGADYITGQVIAVDGGYTTTAIWPFEPK